MKRLLKLTLTLLILNTFYLIPSNAQVGINNDNSNPDASAMLDVKSSDKGMLVPRMSSSQRTMINNAATGLLVFDTTTESFWFKDTNGWLELVSGNISSLADADGDTKIQVEENADEDVIRFDIVGDEKWRMENNTLVPTNEGQGVFIGESAGSSDALMVTQFGSTTPTRNVFIGADAGTNTTTANLNTVVGSNAFRENTTGGSNTAIGFSALEDNLTGQDNVAIGTVALERNEDGNANVAVGQSAALRNEQGSNNIAVGQRALWQNLDGENNLALGTSAGGGNSPHSKEGSIYLGHRAGIFNQGDHNIFIGTDVASTGAWQDIDSTLAIDIEGITDPLIYGEFDTDLVRINGDLEVTGNFPSSDDQIIDKLNLNGTTLELSLEDDGQADQTVNLASIDTDTDDQTLSFDGTNLSIVDGNSVDISSINSVQNIIEDADGDTKIQVEESADEDVIRFKTNGSEVVQIDEQGQLGIGKAPEATVDVMGPPAFSTTETLSLSLPAGSSQYSSNLTNPVWQSFTSSCNCKIAKIDFFHGSPSTTYSKTISIYEGEGTSGNLLFTSSSPVVVNPGSILGWISFPVDAIEMIPNQVYTVAINIGANTQFSSSNPYPGGRSSRDANDDQGIRLFVFDQTSAFQVNDQGVKVGSYTLPYEDGVSAQILTTDGSGTLSWEDKTTNTDDQTLSFNTSNNTLSLEDGGSVDLSSIDTDTNTDNQNLTYNNTNKSLSISGGNTADLTQLAVPVGTIIMWIGDENETVPAGWLVCNNSTYNTSTYSDLFALLGTNRTPNFLGRFPVGAPRDGIGGLTETRVGVSGGTEDRTLSVANLPPHSHEIKFREGEEQGNGNDYSDINADSNQQNATGSTESTGDGTSFKIMPPFLGVQFLIKAE